MWILRQIQSDRTKRSPRSSSVDLSPPNAPPLVETTPSSLGPFVFRQKSGMQKGVEHTTRTGRKEVGYSEYECTCVQERPEKAKRNASWEEQKFKKEKKQKSRLVC